MFKFFTYEERLELQKFLKESLSFKEISRRLDKNPSTISREVRKYSSEVATGYPGFQFSACKNRFNCRKKDVCGTSCTRKSTIYCKLCSSCNASCSDFIQEICTARLRVPYVCNGCETLGKCSLLKNIYDAEHAHIKAYETISESRSGLCVSEDEVAFYFILSYRRKSKKSNCIWVTKTAFRLQIFSCHLQTLHLVLQSGISSYN